MTLWSQMETFNHKMNTYFESWLGPRDQRVRGWLLLDNYPPTLALTVMYLLIVWMGPKYMKHRQPYSCRGVLMLYNLGLTLLSFYMFYEEQRMGPNLVMRVAVCLCMRLLLGEKVTFYNILVTTVWHGGYNFYCQNAHSAQEVDNKIINVLWWYYFSKLIEFMDTFFFILRKNNHQITFLHIYHHASMLNIWWFVMNWLPCGHSYFGPTLNSLVHVVMYSYYGLSAIPAMRPYLWWKKHITQLQLVQFFLTMSHSLCAVVWPCGVPVGWLYFQISYMVTLIFLFSNFYIQTYKKHRASPKKEHQNGSPVLTNGHANWTPTMEHTAHKKLRVD